MILPHADAAQVAPEKITEYLLNPRHPDGAGKATFFSSFGFERDAWTVLAEAFKELVRNTEVRKTIRSPHGTKYVVDGVLTTPSGKMPLVRTVWIVDAGEESHDSSPRIRKSRS